jgi:hypothetical protein
VNKIFVPLFPLLVISCSLSTNGWQVSYSPLEKYMIYPMTQDHTVSTPIALPDYENGLYFYIADKEIKYGIVTNTNYYYFQNNTIINYPISNQLATNIILMTGQQFMGANARFWVRLESNSISVFNYSNLLVTNLSTGLTQGIVCLGNGNSGLIAYGIPQQNSLVSGQTIKYDIQLMDLDTGETQFVGSVYGEILGFSRKNKYLFFPMASKIAYGSRLAGFCSGMIQAYVVNTGQSIAIGNINYENRYLTNIVSVEWFDLPLGISEDLRTLIVDESLGSMPPSDTTVKDDGRTIYQIEGQWVIDISSLGLSE